jgi:hypothetical protein
LKCLSVEAGRKNLHLLIRLRRQRRVMRQTGRYFARVTLLRQGSGGQARLRPDAPARHGMRMRMIWGQEMARFLRGFRGAIFADWPMNFGFPGGIGPGNFHQHNRLVPLGCSWVRRGHHWDRLRWERHLPQGHPWAVEKDWTRLEWLHFLRMRMTRRMSPEGFRGSLRSMRVIYFQGVLLRGRVEWGGVPRGDRTGDGR